ncbi:hypothetical protein GGP56_001794 [Salinibacter ruber]|nr:hypothetical protein [Salinibacter ruber]
MAEWACTTDGIEAQNASALTLKNPKAETAPTPPPAA